MRAIGSTGGAAQRLWAVGFKNWVEIRESVRAPKVVRSTATRMVEMPKLVWHRNPNPDYELGEQRYTYQTKMIKKQFKISVVVYNGGKVLGTIPTMKLMTLGGPAVFVGQMVELPSSLREGLIKEVGK